ncbi:multidrug ABC transporter ATP-binding protein [Loigolactobacillus backii]|uniref:ABC-F family ATP-binding cassette domain-containing protein n=1 Tax=Loigolactobacillus backii TaxID=375175 RepID=UPI000C1C89F5|nr:ABC-F family ATP-binding cassette domain-containing protein [Loigolactobacillus backii]PIO82108.1 multidrug ABC transporter ATP-binding protein [Loigolactobacillus backii]
MSVLTVENLQQQFLDKTLYDDTGFALNQEDHMGIIGQNGVGKSTLIKIITGQILPDSGKITWKKHIKIGYLDQYVSLAEQQTIFEFLKSAFSELYALNKQNEQIYADYAENPDDDLLEKAGHNQEILEAKNFYDIETTINQVASGLGIDAIGLDRNSSELSGGQRSKVILAKLLLEQPDVLLLDEPTNYLDTNHIEWLINYLNNFAGAFIVISHDYDFLGQITNCICDIEFGKITKYRGTLNQARRQKEANKETYLKAYATQQKKIEKTKAYIRKNKAGSRSTIAKSREKQLAHMDILTPPGNLMASHFNFPYQLSAVRMLLDVSDLVVGYEKPLLTPFNFSITQPEKVAITGFNGIGKSTLIKTLLGIIPKLSGDYWFSATTKVGYFKQELLWNNNQQTPLQVVQAAAPKLTQKKVRQSLARAGIERDNVDKPIKMLSGGEQTKVKLCILTIFPANLLILDEPTNHLDEQTKDALSQSLQNFEGSVLLVTHEPGFYEGWIDRVIDIEKLQVK